MIENGMIKVFEDGEEIGSYEVTFMDRQICSHCGFPISFRNFSGYCDHLYYPDGCIHCKNTPNEKRTFLWRETDFLSPTEMEI